MSRLIDVSLPIGPDLLVFPNNPPPQVLPAQRIARGDQANVSELRLGTHTGTHVDPPVHFIQGAAGIDRVALEVLTGPAFVADLRHAGDGLGELSRADLEGAGIPAGAERVLLRTDNSTLWRSPPAAFPERYISLSPGGASWLLDRGVRLVGIDFLSIERRGASGHPVHRTLLGAGAVIVEGLDLGPVEPGSYTLLCLPLRIVGGDGGPARAALLQD